MNNDSLNPPSATPAEDRSNSSTPMKVHGPITFISDVHNAIHNVDKLKNTPNLFCLGDIVDMFDRQLNLNTLGYWHTLTLPTLRGNHDRVVSQSEKIPPEERIFLERLPVSLKLESDFGNILLYHSSAISDDKVVQPNLTEERIQRLFKLSPDVRYVFYGHSHRQQKTSFPCGVTVVNVGALQYGYYAVLDGNGVAFKKLR